METGAARVRGVGIDTVDVERMRRILAEGHDHFLENTFTEEERTYCESHADAAPHYAGTFAAKEAIEKATGNFVAPLHKIEVRRTKEGKPEAWTEGHPLADVFISISHSDSSAVAIAVYACN